MIDIRTIIAELREFEAKATSGPWAWKTDTDGYLSLSNHDAMVIYLFDSWTGYAECGQSLRMEIEAADAALVAASRNALPRLLDYIARLEADNHELRHSLNRASSYADDVTIPNIDAMCEKIKRLEAVADAAEVVYAEWGEEEIACEFEEWRNLRSALDAADCDLKS
jgi:hypothetical protein